MRYIGNCHNQAPCLDLAKHCGLAIDGIVKVAGIGTINRDEGHIP